MILRRAEDLTPQEVAKAIKSGEVLTASAEGGETIEHRVAVLELTVARLSALVDGRNRSAPTKRNMRDEDALAVLTGEFRELDHKLAAAAVGLTYAQVYSCRLGFTFKHVHKDLRDAGIKLPWKR